MVELAPRLLPKDYSLPSPGYQSIIILRAVNIKMYAVSKLNKQHEQTWINLQKRLNSVQFPYQKLFPNRDVYEFIKNKAISVGSCEGYFIPSLLTTTAFVLASNNAQVNITTHKQPLNIFTIFVGYPGTGKFNWHPFIYRFTSRTTLLSAGHYFPRTYTRCRFIQKLKGPLELLLITFQFVICYFSLIQENLLLSNMQPRNHWKIWTSPTPSSARPPRQDWSN